MYQLRTYRQWVRQEDLFPFEVTVKETNLFIRADADIKRRALEATEECRANLEGYIQTHPHFVTSLEPISVDENAPLLVKEMAEASSEVGVGPMAAVAGAIAEYVGRELLRFCHEVIVENGGDIFLKTSKRRLLGVFAGESVLSKRIAFDIQPEETPLGVCTSSGSVGHSLSLGRADAVVVFSPSTALADAAATALGNRVKSSADIEETLGFARNIPRLRAVVIIKDSDMGLWGQVKIAQLDEQ